MVKSFGDNYNIIHFQCEVYHMMCGQSMEQPHWGPALQPADPILVVWHLTYKDILTMASTDATMCRISNHMAQVGNSTST